MKRFSFMIGMIAAVVAFCLTCRDTEGVMTDNGSVVLKSFWYGMASLGIVYAGMLGLFQHTDKK